MIERENLLFSSLGKSLGVDLFSYDFVRDPSYVKDRCGRIIGGEVLDGQSVLRSMLHAGLTEGDRIQIFPGEFDLGNARSIPEDACTYEALTKELEEQRSQYESSNNPLGKADVTRLLRNTAELLGHTLPQERYAGAGDFFKVVKLLHSFKQRDGLLQLMSILRPPTETTAALELTNPYPRGANSDIRWQMIDLQGYLSAEISAERLTEIDGTFGSVRSVLDDAFDGIERVLKMVGRPSIVEVVQRYEVVLNRWTSFRSPPVRQMHRADEQLYLTMHTLDFLHFAKVEHKLRREKLLQRSVTAIPESACLTQSRIRLRDLCERDLPDSVRKLQPLMRDAIGEHITYRQFRDTLDGARTVLNHVVSLRQVPAPVDVDALTALAAFIVAREIRKQPASYKPCLHGSARGQSHSVKTAFKIDCPVSSTHEEFERIVIYAVQRMRYALSGQTAVLEAQQALQMLLIDGAVSVLNTHDTKRVATFLSNLKGYAAFGVKDVPRQAAMKNATMHE
jgi:hypothetical protein